MHIAVPPSIPAPDAFSIIPDSAAMIFFVGIKEYNLPRLAMLMLSWGSRSSGGVRDDRHRCCWVVRLGAVGAVPRPGPVECLGQAMLTASAPAASG